MSQASDLSPDAPRFPGLPAQIDLPAIEREMLGRWEARTSSSTRSSRPRAAAAGPSTRARPPPTACRACTTSRPGCSRTCSPGSRPCRVSTCRARRGWDCHGLPVEVAVERSWGSPARRTSRPTASPSSTRAAGSPCCATWTRSTALTERMGYWIDLSKAYRTMDPAYVESVWWSLKADLQQGPAGQGLPDQPVLPALRHRRCPTTRWASPTSTRPSATRRSPSASRC